MSIALATIYLEGAVLAQVRQVLSKLFCRSDGQGYWVEFGVGIHAFDIADAMRWASDLSDHGDNPYWKSVATERLTVAVSVEPKTDHASRFALFLADAVAQILTAELALHAVVTFEAGNHEYGLGTYRRGKRVQSWKEAAQFGQSMGWSIHENKFNGL